MRKLIIIAVLVILSGMAATQFSTAYKKQMDFAEFIEKEVTFVDDTNQKTIAKEVRDEAYKRGIDLGENDLQISYKPTDLNTVAQKIVSRPLHAQFQNKQAVIKVRYTAHVLGIPLPQEIERSHLQQEKVTRPDENSQLKQVMDGAQ
jgi:hypothetical protein